MPDHWWFHEAQRDDDLFDDSNFDDYGGGDGGGDDYEDLTQPEYAEPRAVPVEPDVFRLELRTDDHRTVIITGDMALFSDRARLATEEELHQMGGHIADAINTATRELE